MGYTSGVAETLYKKFEDNTYLTLETYPKMSRKEALKKFDSDYTAEDDSAKDFLHNGCYFVYNDEYDTTLYEMVDGTYTVVQSDIAFIEGLSEGGYQYDLTPTGEEKQAQGEELDEDDFNYIRLGVAGEHIGDISVWYDLINDTVGGRDFIDKSVAQFTYQINDSLYNTLSNILYEINHN